MFDLLAQGNINLVKHIYERYERIMERENAPVKKLKVCSAPSSKGNLLII
jgi:hypothetical protein